LAAEARLALLREATVRIGSALNVTRTAEELTEVAIPAVADFVAVDLLVGVTEGEEPAPGLVEATGVRLRRAAVGSVTPGAPEATVPVGSIMSPRNPLRPLPDLG
jgi:sodium/proline symporter